MGPNGFTLGEVNWSMPGTVWDSDETLHRKKNMLVLSVNNLNIMPDSVKVICLMVYNLPYDFRESDLYNILSPNMTISKIRRRSVSDGHSVWKITIDCEKRARIVVSAYNSLYVWWKINYSK